VVAPFEFNGVQQSWWSDRNGDARYFWAGTNTNNNAHTCQCGIDLKDISCNDPTLRCNCDAVRNYALFDKGMLVILSTFRQLMLDYLLLADDAIIL